MAQALPPFLGLAGRSGSGKTTAALYLKSQGYELLAFADVLKEVVQKAFGFQDEQVHGSLKEAADPRFGKSPRYCLQYLGTACREIWPEVWIWHLRRRIMDLLGSRGFVPLVVTDVRLRNEVKALKRLGAVLVRLERQEAGAVSGIPGHVSEKDLDRWAEWDWTINNNGTVEELFRKLDTLLISIRAG